MTKKTDHVNSPAREAHDRSQAARLLAEWRAAVADMIAAFHAQPAKASKVSDDFEAADECQDRIARAAWALPIADPAGLRLRAEIVRDTVWPKFDDEAHRFERVLAGDEPKDDVVVGAFDERAVAELVKAVLSGPEGAEPTRTKRAPAPNRKWLEQLRDAGPDGAAPDPHHAEIWGDILDLRGVRDTIENTLERMTAKLDHLAYKTTLTHAIAAGGPEDEAPEPDDPDPASGNAAADEPEQPAGDAPDRPPLVPHLEDLIGRARDGVTTLYQIWNDRCGGLDFPDQHLAVSLKFCLDGLDALLEEAEKRIVAEIEAPD